MSAAEIRIATTAEDILKVMVVRGIVFIEEQEVDWDGEIDQYENESIHVLGEVDGQPVASGRLRPRDPGDVQSYKTRRGKVGGYVDHLLPGDVAWMEARIRSAPSPLFGYREPAMPWPRTSEVGS